MAGTSAVSKSERGTLNLWDWVKGGIVSVGTGLLTSVISILQVNTSAISFATFKPALIAAVSAFLVYILKQLSTNSDGQLAKENKPGSDNP